MKQIRGLFKTTLLIPLCLLASVHAQNSKGWSYQLELYGLFASINGNSSIGRVQGAPIDVKFEDILENLNMGGMVHFEAFKNEKWGYLIDYGFMDLSSDISGPKGGIADVGVRQGTLEAMVAHRRVSGDTTYDIYGGLRWWDFDLDLTLDPAQLPGTVTTMRDEDWVDIVFGARVFTPMSEKWTFVGNLDIGGFGLEADFTLSSSLGVQYRMTKSTILDLKYKAIWVDFESGTAGTPDFFGYDTVTHGPIVGIIFEF
jgi:hypothetical protein